ncbi:hypothetical protein FKG95_25635 [Denitrobaculum tricleocarpae]|uniref:EF-hand domain-containing protein n=2 Tax=Denitrobaculum tricleocarpae TaxID=2591009 RepID=A0A545T5N7_9PROT|nr:hypothetical protein FKG95_25635 [Denitrobaculum tricleocarpae]
MLLPVYIARHHSNSFMAKTSGLSTGSACSSKLGASVRVNLTKDCKKGGQNGASGRMGLPRCIRQRQNLEKEKETASMKQTVILAGLTLLLTATGLSHATAQSENELATRAAFEAADQNGDGLIDEAELAHDTIEGFVAIDSDGNRSLESGELGADFQDAIAPMDGDGNGSLSFEEVMKRKLNQFKQADSNADGTLTIEEVLTHDGVQ